MKNWMQAGSRRREDYVLESFLYEEEGDIMWICMYVFDMGAFPFFVRVSKCK